MTWENISPDLYNYVLFPLIGILTTFVCVFITCKISQLKKRTDNETTHKYLDMLDKTITDCVLSTTQTYVDTLKKQGTFDVEAQKEALNQTYQNVLKLLTDEAKKYLSNVIGDLNVYILNKIESEVKVTKQSF